MGLFYRISDAKILEIKNKIFLESGVPSLSKNGFERSPFKVDWFGKNNLKDYNYSFCRLSQDSQLERVSVKILQGDKWIQVFLNVFIVKPTIKSLDQLNEVNGLQYHLPPNSISAMRLRIDDSQGMPLFRSTEHRIKSYNSESGFKKRVGELRALIEKDMENIDYFVKRWHELHKPLITDWEGNPISREPSARALR